MSETTRTPINHADVRQRGIQLLRECWKPLLITLLLTNVLTIIAQIIMQPSPVAAEAASDLMNESEIPTVRIVIGLALQLFESLVLVPLLLQGLYRCLLSHLRGETHRLRVLAGGFKRWKTAIALELQIALRVLGYQLLGVIAIFLLSFIPILGALGAAIGYVVLMYWVMLRYFDAKIHLADDADHQLNSTDCITYSLHDAEMYSISGLFKTLWPAFVPTILGSLLTKFLPASLLVSGADLALSMLSFAMQTAICTVIYTHLQTDTPPVQDDTSSSEGLARARALAAGKSAEE